MTEMIDDNHLKVALKQYYLSAPDGSFLNIDNASEGFVEKFIDFCIEERLEYRLFESLCSFVEEGGVIPSETFRKIYDCVKDASSHDLWVRVLQVLAAPECPEDIWDEFFHYVYENHRIGLDSFAAIDGIFHRSSVKVLTEVGKILGVFGEDFERPDSFNDLLEKTLDLFEVPWLWFVVLAGSVHATPQGLKRILDAIAGDDYDEEADGDGDYFYFYHNNPETFEAGSGVGEEILEDIIAAVAHNDNCDPSVYLHISELFKGDHDYAIARAAGKFSEDFIASEFVKGLGLLSALIFENSACPEWFYEQVIPQGFLAEYPKFGSEYYLLALISPKVPDGLFNDAIKQLEEYSGEHDELRTYCLVGAIMNPKTNDKVRDKFISEWKHESERESDLIRFTAALTWGIRYNPEILKDETIADFVTSSEVINRLAWSVNLRDLREGILTLEHLVKLFDNVRFDRFEDVKLGFRLESGVSLTVREKYDPDSSVTKFLKLREANLGVPEETLISVIFAHEDLSSEELKLVVESV